MASNRSCVGLSHDQRRLTDSGSSATSRSGRCARTVNRRRAFTRPNLTDDRRERSPAAVNVHQRVIGPDTTVGIGRDEAVNGISRRQRPYRGPRLEGVGRWPVESGSMTSPLWCPQGAIPPRLSSARWCRSRPRCGARGTTLSRPRWWCATTARTIRRSPKGPRRSPLRLPCRSRPWSHRRRRSNRRPSPWTPVERPTFSTECSPPTGSVCGRSGSTVGATRSRHGVKPSPPNSTRVRANPSCPTT